MQHLIFIQSTPVSSIVIVRNQLSGSGYFGIRIGVSGLSKNTTDHSSLPEVISHISKGDVSEWVMIIYCSLLMGRRNICVLCGENITGIRHHRMG